jgi:hypothetical protein
MSQIGEELIKEIGEIKLIKLSERKIRLDYNVNIICQERNIKKIRLKIRYLKTEDGIYKMYFPKISFLNNLSNKLRVKKNKIHWGAIWQSNQFNNVYDTGKNFQYDEFKLNNFIKSIHISDDEWFIQWNRNNNLNEILNEKG